MSSWSPETGFEDDPNKNAYCKPLVTHENGRVWCNIGEHVEIRKKCEEAKTYFPVKILNRTDKRNFLFPMSFFTPTNDDQKEFHNLFYNEELKKKASMFLFETKVLPFYIHTPALFTLMIPGRVLDRMLSTEIIYQYFCIIQNLVLKCEEGDRTFNPDVVANTVIDDAVEEMRVVAAALKQNLCGSGMMQHYFTEKKHKDAPTELVKLFIQYTIRVIQIMERQILKLTALNFKPGKSETLCLSGKIPITLTEEQQTRLEETSKKFLGANFMIQSVEQVLGVTAPNKKDTEKLNFLLNANLEYCENFLWMEHTLLHKELEEPEELKKTEEPEQPEESKSPDESEATTEED